MIILKNERSELFQWDIGQSIVLLDETLPTKVHFQNINSTQALVVELVGNEAPIPNILLQEPFPIGVYFFYRNNNESHSIKRKTLSVRPRVRPADYVYTETEVFTYAGILEIVEEAAADALSAVQVAQGVRDDADAGVFKGDKGDKGDTGEQGIQGIQGLKGDKGDKGDTGEQGIQGIQGLKGDKGDKGDTGEQGIQGIQGLKGDKGDKGDTGEQGIQGIQGLKGDKGDTGEAGYTPVRGTDYWTAADQSTIISDVLSALPNGDEEDY